LNKYLELEEEFDIEIPDIDSENYLGINSFGSGGSWCSSSSSYFSFRNAGEECIVKNFVELICKKVLD
jgi:hypothetical protein